MGLLRNMHKAEHCSPKDEDHGLLLLWERREEKEQERRSGRQSDYCQGSLLMR